MAVDGKDASINGKGWIYITRSDAHGVESLYAPPLCNAASASRRTRSVRRWPVTAKRGRLDGKHIMSFISTGASCRLSRDFR